MSRLTCIECGKPVTRRDTCGCDDIPVVSDANVMLLLGDPPYHASGPLLEEWCHRRNACYYARTKDAFSTREARELAKMSGNSIVVAENLS